MTSIEPDLFLNWRFKRCSIPSLKPSSTLSFPINLILTIPALNHLLRSFSNIIVPLSSYSPPQYSFVYHPILKSIVYTPSHSITIHQYHYLMSMKSHKNANASVYVYLPYIVDGGCDIASYGFHFLSLEGEVCRLQVK